jgi:acyl-CoA thioesterase II
MADDGVPGDDLAQLLRVERRGEREFAAELESFFGQAQSFDLLGRAALAASATCEGLPLAELRAAFLRPAPLGVALSFSVEALLDGPERACRRVRVAGETALAEVTASFARELAGPEFAPPLPEGLPKPEDLPSTLETARAEGWEPYAAGPIEFRRASGAWPGPPEGDSAPHLEWIRPRAALPAEPRLHAAALVLASHFYAHHSFERRLGAAFAPERCASFDHAVWIHRPARWDDWWLLESSCEVAHGGRALGQRRLFARDGRLLATALHSANTPPRSAG